MYEGSFRVNLWGKGKLTKKNGIVVQGFWNTIDICNGAVYKNGY